MEEAIEILRLTSSREDVDYDGQYWRFRNLTVRQSAGGRERIRDNPSRALTVQRLQSPAMSAGGVSSAEGR
jgi:hypothetical protein